jgi:hypothetical protein
LSAAQKRYGAANLGAQLPFYLQSPRQRRDANSRQVPCIGTQNRGLPARGGCPIRSIPPGYLPGLPPAPRVGDCHDHELPGLDAVEDAERRHGPVALTSPGDITAKARELLCREPLSCPNHGSSLDWCPVSDLLEVLEGPVLPPQTHCRRSVTGCLGRLVLAERNPETSKPFDHLGVVMQRGLATLVADIRIA